MPPRVRGMKHAARRIDHLVGAGEVAANGPDGSRSRTGWPRNTGGFPGAGSTSELLGFGCGVTVTVGGGSCAAAPATENSKTVRLKQKGVSWA